MLRPELLLLFSNLPIILCSCFTQVPWTTSRHVLAMIDPCFTIGICESNCLGNSQCLAYGFVNTRCMLLGVDSGRAQICTSGKQTCWVRTTACDAITTSTATALITTTTATTTTTPTMTTTTTSVCMGLTYAVPSTSIGCVQPDFGDTQVTCAAGYDLYELGAGETSTLMIGPLNCIGGEWTDGATVVPANTAMYCQPQQPVTTTTETPTTTTTACSPQSYDVPAVCGGCMWPAFDSVQTSCQLGYDLFTFDTATQTSTLIGWPLECVNGDWRDGLTVIPVGTNMYCKPKPPVTSSSTTSTTAAPSTTTITSCVDNMSHTMPSSCTGCLKYDYSSSNGIYCNAGGQTLFATADPSTSLTSLTCSGGVWIASGNGMAIPPMTGLYCGPLPTTTTTTTPSTTTTFICSKLPYGTPMSCSGCLSPEFNGSQMYCLSGYNLYSTDGISTSTAMGATLECGADKQWYDGPTLIPDGTQMYCTQK